MSEEKEDQKTKKLGIVALASTGLGAVRLINNKTGRIT